MNSKNHKGFTIQQKNLISLCIIIFLLDFPNGKYSHLSGKTYNKQEVIIYIYYLRNGLSQYIELLGRQWQIKRIQKSNLGTGIIKEPV